MAMTVKTHCSVLLLALVAGCAEGAPVEGDEDADDVDARTSEPDAAGDDPDAGDPEDTPDARPIEPGDPDAAPPPPPIDAAPPPPVDAAPPPPVDAAPPPPDAAMCQTTQLLLNPDFDATPLGTGWTLEDDVLSSTGPAGEDTAPNSLWLGGLALRDEVIYQEVLVPAGLMSLTLTLKFQVRSPEGGNTVYDSATLTVRSASNEVLHELRQWSNRDAATTSWQSASFTIPNTVAGERVRIHFAGITDRSFHTSFQFDTLALTAVACP
jgi:hypothetical protein